MLPFGLMRTKLATLAMRPRSAASDRASACGLPRSSTATLVKTPLRLNTSGGSLAW